MDNAATSFPKPPAVLEAMTRYANELGASAGRGAYREAVETGTLIAECRRELNSLFHAENPEHFIFTLNCTDALNLAIKGLLLHESRITNHVSRTPHAICTAIDHNSILRPLNALADRNAITRTVVPVDPTTGLLDPDDIRRAIQPETRLIALTHASNVTGTLQDIRAIARIARQHGIPLLVDAAQSAGHLPIDLQADNIDLLAAPGHKGLLGPLGTGILYIRPGLQKILDPIRQGGTGSLSEHDRHPDFLPDRYESGSHNAIGIIGLLEGVRWINRQGIQNLAAHDRELIATFIEGLADIRGLTLHGPQGVLHRTGVFSVTLDGFQPYELSAALETGYGVLTRPGLHCAPLIHQTLGTLKTGGTTRFSFGPFICPPDVGYAADALAQIAFSRTKKLPELHLSHRNPGAQ